MAITFSLTRDYSVEEIVLDNVKLEGYVVSEIHNSKKGSDFIFEDENNIRVLVKASKQNNYFYGDKVSIKGDFQIPEVFENDNGIIFDYKNFLLKDDITHIIFYPEIEILQKSELRDFKYYIFYFKNYFIKKSRIIFTKETSSLVLGILFGLEDSFDQELENNFRRTGLIHILVLSGFNLTIIAYFIFKLLGFLHRRYRYLISLILIWIFVIMVGFGATVVRAGIMITIFIFGKLLYRNSASINALVLAASIMILLKPMILLYDPSFQLSFIATFGLISFYKYIEKFFRFLPEKFSLKEIIVSNISVQIMIIPLLIYLMGEFSVISLIPNILVLPIIPVFMLVSFLSILLSYFPNLIFSHAFIFMTEKLADFVVGIVSVFGSLSFSILKTGQMDARFLIYILFAQIIFVSLLNLREKVIWKQKYSYLQS